MTGRRQLGPRGVDADDALDPRQGGGQPGQLPFTAADVEDARRAGQVLGRQGQDLLLVLGVGASGGSPSVNPQAATLRRALPPPVMAPGARGAWLVQGMGHLLRQPRQAFELLEAGLLHRRHPAELLQQALPASRPQPGHVVEDALRHPLGPQLAVVGDGEAVGLVPDALQEVEGLGLPGDANGVGLTREVDLLEALGQGGHRDLVGQAEVLDDLDRHVELALAAVDEQQVGRVGELPSVAPPWGARARRATLSDGG